MAIAGLALPGLPALAQEAGKTIIVLDASGSMWGQIEGKAKIDIAKETIEGLLQSLDPKLQLGLMAYGHRRKGDCEDIELLIQPGKVDRKAFLEVVMNILPKGKTPLTDAVNQAAQALAFTEAKSNVILVSDGIENCDGDVCALAKKLEQEGINFTAHVVAFDLVAKDAKTIECLSKETGGQFLAAQDAAGLKDALAMVVKVVTAAAEPVKPKVEKRLPATLIVPAKVTAGTRFPVKWKCDPTHENDYITIVPKGTKEREWENSTYVSRGNPLELLAPIKAGKCEVRYLADRTRETLGRAEILVEPISATVSGPAEVGAGSEFAVNWTGPDNKGDYVTIVAKGAEEGTYGKYVYSRNGSPAKLRAPVGPGAYELRYVTGPKSITLARAALKVTPTSATVKPPVEVIAGSKMSIEWTGPGNQGDYITIVPKGAAVKAYKSYAYPKKVKGPVTINALEKAGVCEVRYVGSPGGKTLASAEIKVIEAKVELTAPAEIVAGGTAKVAWTKSINPRDFITIVMKGEAGSKYGAYSYASKESPQELTAPETAGDGEVRYVSAKKKKILASRPIRILEAKAAITVAAKVVAREKFEVEWTGPNNKRDFVAIVKKGAGARASGTYVYARNGSPGTIRAPKEAGE